MYRRDPTGDSTPRLICSTGHLSIDDLGCLLDKARRRGLCSTGRHKPLMANTVVRMTPPGLTGSGHSHGSAARLVRAPVDPPLRRSSERSGWYGGIGDHTHWTHPEGVGILALARRYRSEA
jgi:hypothetical protein